MTWRRNGATAETVGGSIWRGKGLEKGPWVQASPGKHLETELADLGLVAEGPPLAILGGLSKCEYTTRPIRSFRLCRNTRTHDVPFGPSFHWPLALPWEGPRAQHRSSPPSHPLSPCGYCLRGGPRRPVWGGENYVRSPRQTLLPRNSPQGTFLFSRPTHTAAGQAGGRRTPHGSHDERHQQGVPYTHAWLQVPSAFPALPLTKGGRLRGCKTKPLPGPGHRTPPQRTARA